MAKKRSFNGKKLQELREAAGLTQDELAEVARVKKRSLERWEQGKNQPRIENLAPIAAKLGVPMEEFWEQPQSKEKRGRGRPKKKQS